MLQSQRGKLWLEAAARTKLLQLGAITWQSCCLWNGCSGDGEQLCNRSQSAAVCETAVTDAITSLTQVTLAPPTRWPVAGCDWDWGCCTCNLWSAGRSPEQLTVRLTQHSFIATSGRVRTSETKQKHLSNHCLFVTIRQKKKKHFKSSFLFMCSPSWM